MQPEENIEETSNGHSPTTDKDEILNSPVLNPETAALAEGFLAKGSLSTGRFKTSNGITIKLDRTNPWLIDKALERFKAPEIPMVYDEEFQADRPNEADPDYQQAVAEFQRDVLLLTTDIYVSNFTVEQVPDGIYAVASAEWEPDVTMFGIPVPASGRARSLCWLKNYALPNDDDMKELITFAFAYNGRVQEADVRARVDSFRSVQEQHTDTAGRVKVPRRRTRNTVST